MNKNLNNMMKEKPDQAIRHIKLNYSGNIEGLLLKIEKEKQPGLILDYIILVQEECSKAIRGLARIMYDKNPTKKDYKKA